jgi:glycosyltransferase involved in cell wall biosynthesis
MNFGKPVFLANKGSLPEIGGDNAFYWKYFDPLYMSDVYKSSMREYEVESEKKTREIVNHAKSYSWQKAARQYIEVYESLLQKT